MFQKTIKQKIKLNSIGIHTGKRIEMNLYPAKENTGILFKRTDINQSFNLSSSKVKEAILCTALYNDNNNYIKTIEHLMSALSMLQIDNLIIEIDNEEIPIMDGSAMPFIYLIKNAGIINQKEKRKFIKIKNTVSIELDTKKIEVKPYNGFKINYEIDFDNPVIKNTNQILSVDFNKNDIINEISSARTFGFMKDVEYLKNNNLALGGGLNNAIIIDNLKIVNPEGLRYEDEFVRHKILDAIGDFYVEGYQILGEITAFKSGHHLNNLLLKKIMSDKKNYSIIELEEINTELNNNLGLNPCIN